MHQGVAAALRHPETMARLSALGAIPGGQPPENFGSFAARENDRYARLVREAGIRAE
jgi:tripartite-type tricarboxylate transporter receptor subunit TctC